MGEIVNLNQFRKARAKAARAAAAAANRAKHGRTRADRATEGAETARRRSALDGAKLDATPPAEGAPPKDAPR